MLESFIVIPDSTLHHIYSCINMVVVRCSASR